MINIIYKDSPNIAHFYCDNKQLANYLYDLFRDDPKIDWARFLESKVLDFYIPDNELYLSVSEGKVNFPNIYARDMTKGLYLAFKIGEFETKALIRCYETDNEIRIERLG